jgi:ABC-type sugar transport system substrate-binding protein
MLKRITATLGVFVLLAGCSSAATTAPVASSAAPVPTTPAASATAAASTTPAPTAASQSPVSVGFAIYSFATPYGQGVAQGARDAGIKLGANVNVSGTPLFDLVGLGQIVTNQVNAGAQGEVAPGADVVDKALAAVAAAGKPIATFDQCSANLATVCLTIANKESGRQLGQKLIELMGGAAATGTVLVGDCIPGFAVIEDRVTGIKEALAAAPGLNVVTPFNSGVDASKNLATWKQEYAAHPDVKLMVSSCSLDTTSIGTVNKAHGNKVLAGGYDVTPETLKTITDGSMNLIIGQSAYLQGYLGVKIVVDSIRSGKPVANGWLDSGIEFVTKDNVATYQGFFTGTGAVSPYEFYKAGEEQDYASNVKPLSEQSK